MSASAGARSHSNFLTSGHQLAIYEGGAKELIKRAGDLPLQLIVQGKPSAWLANICTERSLSIRELHWFTAPHGPGIQDITGLNINAPKVERFSVSRGPEDISRYRTGAVLGETTDDVRYLAINDMEWLPTNHFPSVTHVVFSGALVGPDLHKFLCHCPQLEVLILRRCIFYDPAPDPPSRSHVLLPRLRRLSIHVGRFLALADGLANVPYERINSVMEIIMDNREVGRDARFTGLHNRLDGDVPIGFARDILRHPDYAGEPYTRLLLRQSVTTPTPRRCTFALFNDRGGVAFRSISPLDFDYASLFGGAPMLDHITELWIDGVDEGISRLYMVIRRDLRNLQTVNIMHPEHAPVIAALGMLITNLRIFPRTALAVRVILASGKVAPGPGWHYSMHEVFELLGAFWLLGDRTCRLIVRAQEFPPGYKAILVPMLERSWDSVATEVGDDGICLPLQVEPDDEFSPWDGW
ncbi:hypothetical protein BC628DRAFT_1421059 [Trametes gibbosa]|nr:hypothetical protein BC628DRAFT_1421059 [Trametes gibbosa]